MSYNYQDQPRESQSEWLGKEQRSETVSDTKRLLPCPFCGGKPGYSDPIMIGVAYYTVRCGSCRITTARYNGKEHAAKKWNTRTG